MAKETPFVWFDCSPYCYTQKMRNSYFYSMMEEINRHFVKWNKTFEWKQKMVNQLIEEVGEPKKLNFFQKLFT